MSLHNLMTEFGVTKNSRHNYTQFYQKHLESYRDTATDVLEIGVDTGVSIEVWLRYFNKAHIYGMDITFSPIPAQRFASFEADPRVTLFLGDQGKEEDLNKFIQENKSSYDIIIDDGGHTMLQQQITFANYFQYLKPGGMYVIEDLHTSYISDPSRGWNYGCNETSVTTLDLMRHLESGLEVKDFGTEFISVQKLNEIKSGIQWCKVEKHFDPSDNDPLNNSEMAFIFKK